MPSTTKLLVVLGATGNQGGAILRHFAKYHGADFHLRGITRNPSSSASIKLQDLGVEMVKADVTDISSLKEAFDGATHLFATTDSNQIIFDMIRHPEKLEGTGQTPRTYAKAIEEGLGRNIVDAAKEIGTLKRVVWSGLASPKKWSKGKYEEVTMWDCKEVIQEMFEAEEKLKGILGVLLIGFYLTNALSVPALYGPQKQSDGTYILSLPMSGDTAVPIADVESDVGDWVSALFSAPTGTILVGASEMLTWTQWVHTWAKVNGVEARYEQVPVDEYAARMECMGDAVEQEFQFVEEYGFAGGNPRAVDPEGMRSRGIQTQTSSVEEAMKRIDWSKTL